MEKPNKPFLLRHEEAENTIFDAVDESAKQVPFYLLEGILTNILHQVRAKAKEERDNALRDYDKQLQEYYNSENEGEQCKKQ